MEMAKKGHLIAALAATCVVAAMGALLASNMGFKINYALTGPSSGGGMGSGKNLLALPYIRQTGLNNAHHLYLDIGGPVVSNVAKFNRTTDSLQTYTGRRTSPSQSFTLIPGEGYYVTMNANVNYIIVGTHDPAVAYVLQAAAPGTSKSGKNLYAPPYHITATNALQLMLDIGEGSVSPVANVARYNKSNDTVQTYTGRMGSPLAQPFTIVPGEAYFVTMNSTVPYIASHY